MEAKIQLWTLAAPSATVKIDITLVVLHWRAEQNINMEKYDFLYNKPEPNFPWADCFIDWSVRLEKFWDGTTKQTSKLPSTFFEHRTI